MPCSPSCRNLAFCDEEGNISKMTSCWPRPRPVALTNSVPYHRLRANTKGGEYVLLAGLAQVGRHLDVVLRDAVVVVNSSSNLKIEVGILFDCRVRFGLAPTLSEKG
jgi:hypothetical protein